MIIKEGWLKKEGGKRKNWKDRWFILTSSTLSYYEKRRGENEKLNLGAAKGVIDLSTIKEVHNRKEYKGTADTIALYVPPRVYHCQLITKSQSVGTDLDDWANVIREQVLSLKEKELERVKKVQGGPNSVSTSNLIASIPTPEKKDDTIVSSNPQIEEEEVKLNKVDSTEQVTIQELPKIEPLNLNKDTPRPNDDKFATERLSPRQSRLGHRKESGSFSSSGTARPGKAPVPKKRRHCNKTKI